MFYTILVIFFLIVVCSCCAGSSKGSNEKRGNYTQTRDDIKTIDVKFREKGVPCPNCNHEVPFSSKFCPNCGLNLNAVTSCPYCNAKVNAGSIFCANCGRKIKID